MPAPPMPVIEGLVYANYIGPMSEHFATYVKMLATNISIAWTTWNTSLMWGNLTVSGAGIGAWAGTGFGGLIMQSTPILVPYTPFIGATPYDTAFQMGLAQAIQVEFTKWASSYKFTAVTFMGTCSATPLSPGPFSANNLPMPLQAAGVGMPPQSSLLVNTWKPQLYAAGFLLDSPEVKTLSLMEAIAGAVTQAFTQTYLLSSITGGQVFGVGAPGAGVGLGVSTPSGIIV